MSNYSKLFWAFAALPILTACSNNDIIDDPTNEAIGKDGVFMSINLNPNVTTRSYTDGDNSSNDGTEEGTSIENAIKTAVIVLADQNNNLIAASSVPGTENKGSISGGTVAGSTVYQAIAQFDKTAISSYYSTPGFSPTVRVYVYCNPTGDLSSALLEATPGSSDWVNLEWKASNNNNLWDNDQTGNGPGFVMTNLSIATRDLPSTVADWANYNTVNKAFDLSGNNAPGTDAAVDNLTGRGTISVHRCAARFDFRDGSQIEGAGNGVHGSDFTYAVVNNVDGDAIVNCQIISMALVNMSNSQYYLGRVSNNGLLNGPDYQLCGPEMPWIGNKNGNYVISTYADKKTVGITSDFSTYFLYPFFDASGMVSSKGDGWDWAYCTDIVAGRTDQYGDKNYHVWRYVAENTIPSPDSKQINSQSTGVVFKARILPTENLKGGNSDKWENLLYEALAYETTSVGDNKLLHNNPNTDPIIYSFSGNSLFVTWENVREEALFEAGFDATKGENQALDRTIPLYRTVFGNGGVGSITDEAGKVIYTDTEEQDATSPDYLWNAWQTALKNNAQASVVEKALSEFKKAATTAGFTLYQSSQDPQTREWGYYCYYYYWNRHNDNNEEGIMGPMEFAVVRNNVYKLSVLSLKTLGHPRIPENDPDDPNPEDPDEKSEIYITVSVDIVPWVVRINNIEF